jgi:hypothetical protein
VDKIAYTKLDKETNNTPEAEEAQDFELREGQTGKQIGSAEPAKKVLLFTLSSEEPIEEVE